MPPLDIFLLIGQSNMAGRGRLDLVEPIAHPGISMYRDGAWQPALESAQQRREAGHLMDNPNQAR